LSRPWTSREIGVDLCFFFQRLKVIVQCKMERTVAGTGLESRS